MGYFPIQKYDLDLQLINYFKYFKQLFLNYDPKVIIRTYTYNVIQFVLATQGSFNYAFIFIF